MKDKTNLLTRRNLFFAINTVRILLAVPWVLWLSVGGVLVFRVNPAVVGILWNTVGLSFWLGIFAARKWRAQGFRMTATVLGMFTTAVVLVLTFLFLAVIFDPLRASIGLDFTSLAVIFLTTNMVIMSWLVFINHAKLRDAYQDLNQVSGARDEVMAEIMGVLDMGDGEEGMAAKAKTGINVFIDGVYTIDSKDPMFWLADPMADTLRGDDAGQKRKSLFLYGAAQLMLATFFLVCSQANDFGSAQMSQAEVVLREPEKDIDEVGQAAIIWFNVCVLDASLWLLRRGKFSWDPGYEALIMTLGRFSLVLFAGEHWLLGHALAYFVFTVAVAKEVVMQRFPHQSDDRAAGAVAYFGRIVEPSAKARNDISGQPEFVLAFLSFFNLAVLLIASSSGSGENPPTVAILGGEWPVSVFASLSFCTAIIYALVLCAIRTSLLDKFQLLKSEKFFAYQSLSLPAVFGMAALLFILCSGIFMSLITGSNLFWEAAVFLPLIFACASQFWKFYTLNECTMLQPAHMRAGLPEPKETAPVEGDEKKARGTL